MFAKGALLLCLGVVAVASAPIAREQQAAPSEYDYEYEAQAAPAENSEPAESASHYDAYIQDVPSAASGGGNGKKGFSRGSGLRTIAQGSANQAKTALGNQDAAGHQAAYVAKNTLAQSAAQASATAQAALAGKQVILSGLEQQVRDAKVALQGEEMQLQQAQRSAQAAAQAAQQAMHQVNVIQAALNAAQATSENANEAASQAAGELGAQTAMVGAARQRLHSLQEQLHGVRIDFEATQAAARKAQAAAQQAQANAAAAAAKAAAAGLSAKSHHDVAHEDTKPRAVESPQAIALPLHPHANRIVTTQHKPSVTAKNTAQPLTLQLSNPTKSLQFRPERPATPARSGGARRRRPPTASRLKGPRKQKSFAYKLLKRGLAKSFAYKLLKRGLANLMSPTSTSGVAPPLPARFDKQRTNLKTDKDKITSSKLEIIEGNRESIGRYALRHKNLLQAQLKILE
ncbi:hypothetical protein EVAR_93560_1 [Eumeta japonica]|uniref:Uncharacterized protein n=1 Tax=Eumeta variegata TaxID=151549 RepID=A0A4C1UR39_EUMVA|nr:hypothetical protein EVAR_93560_1 [Eumeta japonica]